MSELKIQKTAFLFFIVNNIKNIQRRSLRAYLSEIVPKAFGTPRNDGSTELAEVYFLLSFTIAIWG